MVSNDATMAETPHNHAMQRTAGAPRFQLKNMAVGGAPAAADGERWADSEKRQGSTLDGGEDYRWGEGRPQPTPAMMSTGSRRGCLI